MSQTFITVHADPDALIRVYQVTPDEVIYVDNTDDDGQTARISLQPGAEYHIDVTTYPQ